MKKFDDLYGDRRYEELEHLTNRIAFELISEGYKQESIFTFLHKTVDAGIHKAECGLIIGREQ